jgi:hypothetical protein
MPSITFDHVNIWAVLVAALATFLVGALWYTALFGKRWQQLQGFTEERMKEMQAIRPPPVFFSILLACYLVLAVVVAILAGLTGVTSAAGGMVLGVILWVGPTAALKMTDHNASFKPHALFAIDGGFQLVALLITGAIIGAWR